MGVKLSTLSRRFSGELRFYADELASLSECLNVPIEVFFREPADVESRLRELAASSIWYSGLGLADLGEDQMELPLLPPADLRPVR